MSVSLSRVSQLSMQRSLIDEIKRQQAAISRTQQEVASGRRTLTDPAQVASVRALERFVADQDRYAKSSDVLAYRLGLGEGVLGSAVDILQRVRELAVMSNNDGIEPYSQSVVATEIEAMREQLLGIANTRDAMGEYLFGGSRVNEKPFVQYSNGVLYQGDELAREVRVAESVRIRDSIAGSRVFSSIPQGNGSFVTSVAAGNAGIGYIDAGDLTDATAWAGRGADRYVIVLVDDGTGSLNYEVRENDESGSLIDSGAYRSGQQLHFLGVRVELAAGGEAGDQFVVQAAATEDIFATLQRFMDALNAPIQTGPQKARLTTEISNILRQLDQALNTTGLARSEFGTRLVVLEDAETFREDQRVLALDSLSNLRDTDYAESVAKLQAQMTALQVAQQAYSKFGMRTLFDYL
jgi:flagellar hook-associated protein 3 FlgL